MKVSLVILNYNRSEFIDRAIRSCQNQIAIGFETEIIVVDDASTDNSVNRLQKYRERITMLENEENYGVGYSSNVALEASTGDYFMRVDSDDFLSPLATVTLLTAITCRPGVSFAFADHFRIDENEQRTNLVELTNRDILIKHGAGVLFKTSALKSVSGYRSDLRNAEDADLFFRLFQKGHVGVHVAVPLYRYYIHGKNLSETLEQAEAQEALRRNYEF